MHLATTFMATESARTLRSRPRVGFKKSRRGCTLCRSRRVKCDEQHPQCGNCVRLGHQCVYAPHLVEGARSRNSSSSRVDISDECGDIASEGSNPSESGEANPEENRSRRLMELRLLHHWMARGSQPFTESTASDWRRLWQGDMPRIALENDHLLYALFALSATQLLQSCPADEELLAARQAYWDMALRSQQRAVARANALDADALTLAALLISINAFTFLGMRSLDPYTPPSEWLDVGQGASFLMRRSPDGAEQPMSGGVSRMTESIRSAARVGDGSEIAAVYRPLLASALAPEELHDADIVSAYSATLSYISALRVAQFTGEPAYVQLRRICCFAVTVPLIFRQAVRESRPRALVILAYFFAVVANSSGMQYLGAKLLHSMLTREIFAIRDRLGPGWHSLMQLPVDEISLADQGATEITPCTSRT